MASIASASCILSPPTRALPNTSASATPCPNRLSIWRGHGGGFGGRMVAVRAAPERISEKVAESIKEAQEACSENPTSGECAAAWDEVEELSAAASHARDREKDSDPLETYCKDNPETNECRTYEN